MGSEVGDALEMLSEAEPLGTFGDALEMLTSLLGGLRGKSLFLTLGACSRESLCRGEFNIKVRQFATILKEDSTTPSRELARLDLQRQAGPGKSRPCP